ncbi:MAG: hypothetical protein GY787_07940 [Alteromonadales bacterium]|nr:hypothetical protein [Alteromonadales bacterium]
MEKKKKTDLEIACKDLLIYLNENHHPHVTVIVTPTSVEFLESKECNPKIFEFLVD